MSGTVATIDIARTYRAAGIQVVQAYMPGEELQWKRPRGKWRHYEHQWVTDAELERWRYVWDEKPNLGMICGQISHGAFVLDIDTYKSDGAAQWWAGMLAAHNSNRQIRTPTQRTGGGGTQMVFRAPIGWRPPTGISEAIPGIDCRGEGGFAMLPPSLHESGDYYRWIAGLGIDEVEIAVAPQWLCDEIDRLLATQHDVRPASNVTESNLLSHVNGSGHVPRLQIVPARTVHRLDNRLDDLREQYMTRLIWAAVVGAHRDAPTIDTVAATALRDRVWGDYLQHVDSRLTGPADELSLRLEQEGRGWTVFRQKWQYAMAKWDGAVARAAAQPDPHPDQPEKEEQAEKDEEDEPAPDSFKPESSAETFRPALAFTPYKWIDPSSIPPRRFLYGRHYIRQFLSTDISPGGIGKSSLAIADAVAMASHRDLLGIMPNERLRVAYWNGEDPLEELQRRVQAVCLHYGVKPEEIEGRLFVDSGRLLPLILAHEGRNGVVLDHAVIDAIIASLRKSELDALLIDPFIASHRVGENDNNAIEMVAKAWSHIADVTGCAVNLVHHSRKLNGEEVTVESGRGASALLAACRSARTLNQMTKDEAAQLNVEQHRLYFRVDDGKSNLQPPADGATWHRLVNVDLPNGPMGTTGDKVGVVTRWERPDPMDGVTVHDLKAVQNAVAAGRWRENIQARDWIGKAIARTLNLSLPENTSRVKFLIRTWMKSGALVSVMGLDSHREQKEFIEVGKWVESDD